MAHPDGTVTWISPCGRRTTSEPFDYRGFTDDLPVWTEYTPVAVNDPGQGAAGVDTDDDPPPF